MKKRDKFNFSVHISISSKTKLEFTCGDKTARLDPAKDLPKEELLEANVLKVIHEQVYILLSCNRRRANRVQ